MPLVLLGQLLGRSVLDRNGCKVGVLKDVIADFSRTSLQTGMVQAGEIYPALSGIVVVSQRRHYRLPMAQLPVDFGQPQPMALNLGRAEMLPLWRNEGEVLIGQEVLDKPLLERRTVKVIHPNEVWLGFAQSGRGMTGWLVAADVSLTTLLSRVAPWPFQLRQRLHRACVKTGAGRLDWKQLEYLAVNAPRAHLNGFHPNLSELGLADLATLLMSLSFSQGREVVAALDKPLAAKVLKLLPTGRAQALLEPGSGFILGSSLVMIEQEGGPPPGPMAEKIYGPSASE